MCIVSSLFLFGFGDVQAITVAATAATTPAASAAAAATPAAAAFPFLFVHIYRYVYMGDLFIAHSLSRPLSLSLSLRVFWLQACWRDDIPNRFVLVVEACPEGASFALGANESVRDAGGDEEDGGW
jgi:hypothetical protein